MSDARFAFPPYPETSSAPPEGYSTLGEFSTFVCKETRRLLVPNIVLEGLKAVKEKEAAECEAMCEPMKVEVEPECPSLPQTEQPRRKERGRSKRREVQIFTSEALAQAECRISRMDNGQKQGAQALLKAAGRQGGYRALPRIQPALKRLSAAQSQFANLREPISKLCNDLTLANVMCPSDFHVPPILLTGPPGIGKTHFARQLAQALSVEMRFWSAGGAQAAFQLTGGDSGWSQSKPGLVLESMAHSDSSSPVFVLDEVDKVGTNMSYPILPVFLDLLERNTARTFEDTFFGMPFDASRIIYVLTANDVELVPEPILSRVHVFDIPPPEPAQRLQIIRAEFERLKRATRKKHIELDMYLAEVLADRVDIDLRQTSRLVTDAFSAALMTGKVIACPAIPRHTSTRVSIGFVRDSE